jgi:3-hydroxyacyl-CoA dehydrogenase
MLSEGLLPEEVDGAAANFGMKIGPLGMSDIVGLDLGMPRDDDLKAVPRASITYLAPPYSLHRVY